MTDDQMQRTDIPQDKNRTMREAFTMTDYKNNARNHLKANLHLTETCNYRCRYCFAHFENGSDLPLEGWKQIVDNLTRIGKVELPQISPILGSKHIYEYRKKLEFT